MPTKRLAFHRKLSAMKPLLFQPILLNHKETPRDARCTRGLYLNDSHAVEKKKHSKGKRQVKWACFQWLCPNRMKQWGSAKLSTTSPSLACPWLNILNILATRSWFIYIDQTWGFRDLFSCWEAPYLPTWFSYLHHTFQPGLCPCIGLDLSQFTNAGALITSPGLFDKSIYLGEVRVILRFVRAYVSILRAFHLLQL